jgi:hypothetical protein
MARVGTWAVATLLALGMAGGLPIGTPAALAADIDEQIASAKTAADHEAIAKWYDERAKEAEDKAAVHRKTNPTRRRPARWA